jgi:hypothetical protein
VPAARAVAASWCPWRGSSSTSCIRRSSARCTTRGRRWARGRGAGRQARGARGARRARWVRRGRRAAGSRRKRRPRARAERRSRRKGRGRVPQPRQREVAVAVVAAFEAGAGPVAAALLSGVRRPPGRRRCGARAARERMPGDRPATETEDGGGGAGQLRRLWFRARHWARARGVGLALPENRRSRRRSRETESGACRQAGSGGVKNGGSSGSDAHEGAGMDTRSDGASELSCQ